MFIGIGVDRDALSAALDACLASDEELAAAGRGELPDPFAKWPSLQVGFVCTARGALKRGPAVWRQQESGCWRCKAAVQCCVAASWVGARGWPCNPGQPQLLLPPAAYMRTACTQRALAMPA